MAQQLPEHVVKEHGSSRAFRQTRRKQVREMQRLLDKVRVGCAYYPSGSSQVERLGYELTMLAADLSTKNWGR